MTGGGVGTGVDLEDQNDGHKSPVKETILQPFLLHTEIQIPRITRERSQEELINETGFGHRDYRQKKSPCQR